MNKVCQIWKSINLELDTNIFNYVLCLSHLFLVLVKIIASVNILNTNNLHTVICFQKVKLATVVEGNQKAPFSIAATPMCSGERYPFPRIAPLYP